MAEYSRDPVCGMPVRVGEGYPLTYEDRPYLFCSELCRATFLQNPARYAAAQTSPVVHPRSIAYFSMEVGVDPRLPTYAGGLGIVAGDTLKSFADLEVPVIAVTLLHRKGYFDQRIDEHGRQEERPVRWDPARLLKRLPTRVRVDIENRPVVVQAWQYDVVGATDHLVPLILLDTDVPENPPETRELTSFLYGGDERYRLAQEIVLGIGGVRMLRALGHDRLTRFHMNEGHSSLLAVELLREGGAPVWDYTSVRDRCVFTTHTPVPAGHDQFEYPLVRRMLGDVMPLDVLQMLAGRDRLNMTNLALSLSKYVNGVAKRHGEVSKGMFPGYPIGSITNGVHSLTWTCPAFAELYDRHIPGWGNDPFSLRHAMSIPEQEIWEAHSHAKTQLIAEVNRRAGGGFRGDAFTLGFARRAALYKRADLLFADPQKLVDTARNGGPLQIVFAGKAHPHDEPGKDLIRKVVGYSKEIKEIRIAYLENYDMDLARLFTSGVDIWLNTPVPPLEASGTSGMKAAHNGVPSLSILDGWWIEGCIEGLTGWSFGTGAQDTGPERDARDAHDLYDKLRYVIAPMFHHRREQWIDVMRHSIALNASHFNSHRMVQQYVSMAYS